MDEIGAHLDRAIGTSWPGRPLFGLGRVFCTPGANRAAEAAELPGREEPCAGWWRPYLERHRRADWPELSDGDREANLSALESGARIVGAYELPKTGERVWIITEAEILVESGTFRHRPSTTVLLPEEY